MSIRRENEEKGNSSDTKMAEIKKKIVEEEQEDEVINLQIGTSNSLNQIGKVPINEESERSPKRSRNTESNEAESSKKNEQESDSDSDYHCLEFGQDPLLLTEKILLMYYGFIDHVNKILKNDEEKQDWSEILERVKMMFKNLCRNLRAVTFGMEGLVHREGAEKQYEFRKIHILNILVLFRHVNSGLANSRSFRVVSDIKNRGNVLPICRGEFERSILELSPLIIAMRRLKEMALKLDNDK